MNNRFSLFLRVAFLVFLLAVKFQPQFNVSAAANLAVNSITWNVIGLDSNNVSVGPNHFPIGARVCNSGDVTAANLNATFTWDSVNAFINTRPGTLTSLSTTSLAAGACTDFYFEVEVTRNSAAYDTTRDYHITVTADGGLSASTPTPRTLYVEHLVSQSRNAVTDVQYGTSIPSLTSVAAGGTMTLMVGNTYFIRLIGFTATQGYEQLESFINIPNTIFQVLSVNTTYTADSSAAVSSPNDKAYGDACIWENAPASPNYRACLSTGKVGGDITVTYQVTILQVPGAPLLNPAPLSSLIYDFSGSSYHYNADYDVSTRFANIVNASIVKSFSPKTINPGGISTLTFTINNPGPASLTGVNFSDTLPSGVAVSSSTITYSGCGAASPASLSVGAAALSFSNITVTGLSTCTIAVSVTASTDATYNNISDNLFINTSVNTGSFAADSLVVSSTPAAPSSCSTRTDLATWTLENHTASTSLNNGPFAFSSKQTDVSGAATTAAYITATGNTSAIVNTTTVPATWPTPSTTNNNGNSWGLRGGWLDSNPADPATAATPFFQFQADASNYGGIGIAANYNLRDNWSNSGNWYVLVSTNGTTWSSLGNGVWDKGNAWQVNGITTNSTLTGQPTVYFRVFAAGGQYSGNPSTTTAAMFLDNIRITGCPRPVVPTLSKAFQTNPIPQAGTSILRFVLTNPNTNTSLTGVSFSDILPVGLTVASSSSAACGGTLTSASPRTISLSGGTLAASVSCNIDITVTGATAGQYTNTSGTIASTEAGPNTTATGYGISFLTVIAPPVIAKSFTANPIFAGNTTSLSFSINNPNIAATLTGLNFIDTLPAGLDVVDSSSLQCGGTITVTNNAPAQDTISLSGGSLTAGESCSFNVPVTGTTVGLKTNSVIVGSTNGGTGNTDTANVLGKTPAPAISILKHVGSAAIGPWTPSLTVNLPGNVYYRLIVENVGDLALNSVNVSDPNVSTAGCAWEDGSGTPLTAPFSLPVADADDHQIAICVLGPIAADLDSNPNTATASGTNGVTVTDTSTATYTGLGPNLGLAKTNGVTSVTAGGTTIYTLTVTNSGNIPTSGTITIVDVLPTGLNVADGAVTLSGAQSASWICTAASNVITCRASAAIAGSGGTSAFNFTVNVDANAGGTLLNQAQVGGGGDPTNPNAPTSTTAGQCTGTNTPDEGCATDADTIVAPPSISKNFTPDPILINGTTTLTFAITNPNSSTALTGVGFTDPLPAGLEVASTPNATTSSCGSPTFVPTAADISLSFIGGTIAANGTCTVSVDINATSPGMKNNTSGNVTSTNGGTGNTASDTLTVNNPSMNIVKEVATAASGPWSDTSVTVNVGDPVYYRIRVSNTGDVTLANLVVDDGMAGCTLIRGSDLTGDTDADFEAGEEWQYTCSVSALAGTNNNTATADSDQTPLDSDDASYTGNSSSSPSLTITKDGVFDLTIVPPNGQVDAGDVINYTIRIQNTGNTVLTGVEVTDALVSDLDCDGIAGVPYLTNGLTINIGATRTCVASYTLTQNDLDTNGGGDGDIDNAASVDSNETGIDSDANEETLSLSPDIHVTKTLVGAAFNNPNEVRLTYTIVVQNTGNVTLTNLQVTDDLLAAFPGAASFSVSGISSADFALNPAFDGDLDIDLLDGTDSLGVGASGSITLILDVDTGGDEDFYLNRATGFGDPPSGPTVQDSGQAGAPGFVDPALTKAVNVTQASVGDAVTFTITVTNEGNVPAPNVVVVDTLPAVFDVTAVNVAGAPVGTLVSIVPAIGVGPAPYTVTVTIGGVGGNLGVTDVVFIQIVTTVNSLGAPPIVNNAGLTTTALTDNVLNNNDSVSIALGVGPTSALSLPSTGFAPNVVTPLVGQPPKLKYADTDILLEIPSLGVKIPILGVPFKNRGWDVSWLANQAGWLEGSAFPSWKGNSVLTGHVYLANGLPGPFVNLGGLKYGDRIIIHALGQKYIFEIRTNAVVASNDSSILRHEDSAWLTLVTCKEYDEKTTSYLKRVVVRAVLVEVK